MELEYRNVRRWVAGWFVLSAIKWKSGIHNMVCVCCTCRS